MGRAHNSFTSYVGHADEIIQEDNNDLPEKALWVAVLCRAVLDACKGPPELKLANVSHRNQYTYDRNQARHFFMEGGAHFREVCDMAGRNPDYVQKKIRKVLLRKNGWNLDESIRKTYRQKKYGKKHLTGNAYYAAKAKKNFYYQGMGAKGGRPRIYNKIEETQ